MQLPGRAGAGLPGAAVWRILPNKHAEQTSIFGAKPARQSGYGRFAGWWTKLGFCKAVMALHPDFNDLLAAFADAKVEYLIVGDYAVGFHAQPHFTKDIDIWIGDEPANMRRVRAALDEFGAPLELIEQLDSAGLDDVLWMGVPPLRIDLLKGVPGGQFAEAHANRVDAMWDETPVSIINREDLICIKKASNRPQDHLDIELLESTRRR